jgi:hypothetical protein
MMVIPNRARVVAVMLALALAGGLLTQALLAKPTQAQAEPITDSYWSTFTDTYPGCDGAAVHIQGTTHTVAHSTIDENGVLHTQFHQNFQGQGKSKGGGQYVFHGTYNFNENVLTGVGDGYNGTIMATSKLIRQGSSDTTTDDDRYVKYFTHVTVNAQGEITANVVDFEEVCM